MKKNNQKTIIIHKGKCDKDNLYCVLNLDNLDKALQTLSGNAFKMWIYFAKNQDEYKFDLSSKYAMLKSGLSKKSYDNAIHELIHKGFLENSNHLIPLSTVNLWNFNEGG